MSTKTDTLEQHSHLHQLWAPPYCCLCNAEARIKELEEKIKKLELGRICKRCVAVRTDDVDSDVCGNCADDLRDENTEVTE